MPLQRSKIWSCKASDFLRKPGCLFLCLEVRKSNVFEAVKQAVPTRQAAESYGVQVGRNGMACCPFHDDKHPSMKVDRRFHCFGCQADGDVIDFTARLFGLNKKEAALKLTLDRVFCPLWTPKVTTRPAGGRSNGKSARNCATGRRSRNVSGCCAITCICWNAGRRNTPHRRRRKHGIRCLWSLCKKKTVHGVSAGYSAVRQYGGTGLRGR